MEKGIKHDQGKLRMDLLPPEAIFAIASVMTHGAVEYGENTWQNVESTRYEAAIKRHLLKRDLSGWRSADPKSGYPHSWHALCSLAFVVAQEIRSGIGQDQINQFFSEK